MNPREAAHGKVIISKLPRGTGIKELKCNKKTEQSHETFD